MQCNRRWLLRSAVLGTVGMPVAWAQSSKTGAVSDSPTVVQIADMSAAHIDVSRDFLVGARAAWQEISRKGDWRGKAVSLQVLEVDGSDSSLRIALENVRSQSQVIALMGSVGDRAASLIAQSLPATVPGLAHIAPWLHSANPTPAGTTFSIFATRYAQIAHALKSLASVGVAEIGAVYASEPEYNLYRQEVESIAASLGVRCKTLAGRADLQTLGQTLAAGSPRIIVFMGGTPELQQFAQGVGKQPTQRYIVAMSDVNLQTLQQLGTPRNAAIIVTQVVPMVNSNLPVVRAYRETLTRFFDEPPTPHSLAGYLAARYCHEVLSSFEGALTRASALQAFQARGSVDLGGLSVDGRPGRSVNAFVTQSMLSANGRVVG